VASTIRGGYLSSFSPVSKNAQNRIPSSAGCYLPNVRQMLWGTFSDAQVTVAKKKRDPESVSEEEFAQPLHEAGDARKKFLELAREELQMDR
jgi:hypothetical protein